jgi:hypothetical protein
MQGCVIMYPALDIGKPVMVFLNNTDGSRKDFQFKKTKYPK